MTQYKVILVPAHSAISLGYSFFFLIFLGVYLSQTNDVLGRNISNASGLFLFGGPFGLVSPSPFKFLEYL